MSIVVYGREGCGYCTRATEWLTSRNLPFKYVDVLKEYTMAQIVELKNKYDTKTVPIIVIDDKYIGGYTELTKLEL